MLKKVAHIGLSLLLLISTTGVSVSKHICGQIIYDVSLMAEADSCHGSMHKDKPGCCEDEISVFQVDDEFQTGKQLKADCPLVYYTIQPLFFLFLQNFTGEDVRLFAYVDPPPVPATQILKKVQSFLL